MFSERYQKALAFKSLDVEELIDRRFHRPLAAVFTALIGDLPIQPNHVTMMSLGSGWIGAFALYQAFFNEDIVTPFIWLIAGFFLFGSVILDCADGQLARSRGGGSRAGRILDGLVDVLVLLPTYVILGFGIKEFYGTFWIGVAAVAGFSTWIHCVVYDKVKNLYLANTMPEAGGAEGAETVEAVRREFDEARTGGSVLERILLGIYLGYLHVQERFTSGSTENRQTVPDAEAIESYRRENRGTMRLASWLGLGTHMFLIYGCIALVAVLPEAILALQVVFATIFNLVLIIVLLRSRRFAKTP
ncbi:MAG: CDP-alcohol phosphatidyltransferase family protein [Bradymonadaceae bacterium]